MLPFPSNFIDQLTVTSSQEWIQNMEHHALDMFDYVVLVLPFESNGHTSVFAILGAKHIREYMKYGFNEHRSCVLHIVPYHSQTQGQIHAYNASSAKIRTWLNVMWRVKRSNNDFVSMPITNRSMPLSRPLGKFL